MCVYALTITSGTGFKSCACILKVITPRFITLKRQTLNFTSDLSTASQRRFVNLCSTAVQTITEKIKIYFEIYTAFRGLMLNNDELIMPENMHLFMLSGSSDYLKILKQLSKSFSF